MYLRDSTTRFGAVSILLHWVIALAVFGLFGLGLWMTDLTYYDRWYNDAPWVHRSVGILLFGVLMARMVWRRFVHRPEWPASLPRWEQTAARGMHHLLLTLLLLVIASGYLISAADGRPIEVFGWFTVPSLELPVENQADRAGSVHLYLSWTLITLALLHAGAAFKHHFINRDRTLLRMLWPTGDSEGER